jgi:enoyl-CoA hydratase/carnithine racemase
MGIGMSAPEYTDIRYRSSDGIATITLSRPDRLNAFTETMSHELVDAFDTTDTDDDVRVVIVTGAGRAFCAGADLASGSDTFHPDRADRKTGHGDIDGVPRDAGGAVSLRIAASRKPVIAAPRNRPDSASASPAVASSRNKGLSASSPGARARVDRDTFPA